MDTRTVSNLRCSVGAVAFVLLLLGVSFEKEVSSLVLGMHAWLEMKGRYMIGVRRICQAFHFSPKCFAI